jgi:hypothetical protein
MIEQQQPRVETPFDIAGPLIVRAWRETDRLQLSPRPSLVAFPNAMTNPPTAIQGNPKSKLQAPERIWLCFAKCTSKSRNI